MKNDVPDWVYRSPQIFYAVSVLLFFGYFTLGMVELESAQQFADDSALRIAMVRTLLDALNQAIYMVGTGLWLHVMIILWTRVICKLEDKGE